MKKLIFILILFTNVLVAQTITVHTNSVSLHDTRIGKIEGDKVQYDKWTFTSTAITWETLGERVVFPVVMVNKEHSPFNYTYSCMSKKGEPITIYLREDLIAIGVTNNSLLLIYRVYKIY